MNNLIKRSVLQYKWRTYLSRSYAIKSATTEEPTTTVDKVSFDEVIKRRQAEATRSIVVQVSSEKSFNELYNYCHAFGNIVNAQHYCMNYDDEHHYILMEFSSKSEAILAMESSAYNDELTGVPVRSPFLWFRANSNRKRALQSHDNLRQVPPLQAINGLRVFDNTLVNSKLQAAGNIEEQIKLLHELTKLNDLGVRLRFLAALQVQQALIGMFPEANAQPFGSSVNGFGKMGCDLDLILRFDREMPSTMHKKRHSSRLVFHMKENLSNGRSQTQRQMESIGDMLQLFLPGVCHVRRILQARVPILKYHHEHMNLEVDLSMSNLSGFYMSELLYMFGELDERVRPLTFCIRRWAQACGLTNPSPGRWITNFSLTCLVMYFLQQLKQPILPTINALSKSATPADMRMTEDGINCSFGRDLKRLDFQQQNNSQLSELLLQFFEFYSQFDFSNRALSLNEGRAIAKPDHSALYIVNPLENHLNVSKNVSLEECERLRCEVRNAAWILESEVENPVIEQDEKGETHWGLLNLFKTSEKAILRPNMLFKPRMVEVSDLFERTPMADTTADNHTQTDFKSTTVKQQVQQIKNQARMNFKQMRVNSMNTTTTTNADINTTTTVTTKKARRSR